MSSKKASNSCVLQGKPLSRGMGVGKVVFLHGREHQFFKKQLNEDALTDEVKRFNSAYRRAQRSLKSIIDLAKNDSSSATSDIFNSQLMMLTDSSLKTKIEEKIISRKCNAEWAVSTILKKYISKNRTFVDDYFRERYLDLQDVSDRLVSELVQDDLSKLSRPDKHCVFVAREISPATLLELVKFSPVAIVTQEGGWTSHTSILAREFNIPAVSGLINVPDKFIDHDVLLVNGYDGSVYVNPSKELLESKLEVIGKVKAIDDLQVLPEEINLKTLDGIAIELFVNLEDPELYDTAKSNGAAGIGLFRSENIIGRQKKYPTEAEQIEIYSAISSKIADERLTIRTFDIDASSLNNKRSAIERNPALGLRGIRYTLKNSSLLSTQVRAILVSSVNKNVDILLPMITDIDEISAVKKLISKERKALSKKGFPIGDPKLGAMIETPAAVFGIDSILDECDFVCVGTNDLVQYILVADRDNGLVDDWFRSLHPAFLRALKLVIDAAKQKKKKIVICGEMAGSPYYLPVLLGLGVSQISVNPSSLLKLRRVISSVSISECNEMANEMLKSRSPLESEKILIRNIEQKWMHFMDINPDILGNERIF